MEIRKLQNSEIAEALDLVWKVFSEFDAPDYPQQGIEEFQNFIHDETEIKKLHISGAINGGSIIGVLAMRADHISLLFVDKYYHKQGVGKALFQYILKQAQGESITVNSSPYAKDFYHKLGFTDTGFEQMQNGIRFIPMIYSLK